MQTEKRSFLGEVRMDSPETDEASQVKIVGYAAKFNSRSKNLGGFVEIIAPGAFDDVLEDDTRAVFNHDPNFVLGRRSSGTLKLFIDEIGLGYEITPPDTQTVRDLVLTPMERGDINQSSFVFRLGHRGDDWHEDEDGILVRTINKVSALIDVSPVTYPAYTDTDSAKRSLETWQKEQTDPLEHLAAQEAESRKRYLQTL